MKIAIISFYSGNISRGVESWTKEIASHLSKDHDLTVFQNGAEGKDDKEYKVISTNIPQDSSHQDSRNTLRRFFFIDYWSILVFKFTWKIVPYLWKEDFDIYIPTNGGWQSILIKLLSLIKRSKIIIVGHSGKGWDDRMNLWTFPDTFIALTKDAYKWAKSINSYVTVKQIPNGVDLKKFTKEGAKLKLKFENPVILCVGALNPTKRIDLAIKAVSLLPNVDLLVVGEGDNKAEIQELGDKLLSARFHLINVSYEQMPEVYRGASLFTLPSWSREAFPLVYLEALSSNLPIVATDDSIRQEIIGDAGILVDVEDQEKYADALRQALDKKWGDKPRQQASKFSWDKIAKEYEQEMLRILKK